MGERGKGGWDLNFFYYLRRPHGSN
uniref:Uncharacterized protein n=1 Tax=Arundo donax TaxID=35708 RepID=A0A0A9BBS9_ARUDO